MKQLYYYWKKNSSKQIYRYLKNDHRSCLFSFTKYIPTFHYNSCSFNMCSSIPFRTSYTCFKKEQEFLHLWKINFTKNYFSFFNKVQSKACLNHLYSLCKNVQCDRTTNKENGTIIVEFKYWLVFFRTTHIHLEYLWYCYKFIKLPSLFKQLNSFLPAINSCHRFKHRDIYCKLNSEK